MTDGNEKYEIMSLESSGHRADTGDMSDRDTPRTTGDRGFSASRFRQAMGPGYQVATFTDQPAITGIRPASTPSPTSFG